MNDATCSNLRDDLEAATGSDAARFAGHLASCAACAGLVRQQGRLERMLSALPPSPRADFGPPALPDVPGGRLFPIRVPAWTAAVAAAVAFVAIAWRWSASDVERIRIERVIDVAGAPPQVDERLLALTGGVEAVAMRRPTEIR